MRDLGLLLIVIIVGAISYFSGYREGTNRVTVRDPDIEMWANTHKISYAQAIEIVKKRAKKWESCTVEKDSAKPRALVMQYHTENTAYTVKCADIGKDSKCELVGAPKTPTKE